MITAREAGDGRAAGKHAAALDRLAARECSVGRAGASGRADRSGLTTSTPGRPPDVASMLGDGVESWSSATVAPAAITPASSASASS